MCISVFSTLNCSHYEVIIISQVLVREILQYSNVYAENLKVLRSENIPDIKLVLNTFVANLLDTIKYERFPARTLL